MLSSAGERRPGRWLTWLTPRPGECLYSSDGETARNDRHSSGLPCRCRPETFPRSIANPRVSRRCLIRAMIRLNSDWSSLPSVVPDPASGSRRRRSSPIAPREFWRRYICPEDRTRTVLACAAALGLMTGVATAQTIITTPSAPTVVTLPPPDTLSTTTTKKSIESPRRVGGLFPEHDVQQPDRHDVRQHDDDIFRRAATAGDDAADHHHNALPVAGGRGRQAFTSVRAGVRTPPARRHTAAPPLRSHQ